MDVTNADIPLVIKPIQEYFDRRHLGQHKFHRCTTMHVITQPCILQTSVYISSDKQNEHNKNLAQWWCHPASNIIYGSPYCSDA